MKKGLKVTVKTNHHKGIYLCYENENLNDYGTGKYIGIFKANSTEGNPFQYLDCRYEMNYNFVEQVLQFFVLYFGKNLKSVKVEWC